MAPRLLSIVIPAFNAAASIDRTICSIRRCEEQADWQIEIIVVDDGSSDSAALALACQPHPNVTIVRHENNRGMCAARNTGIAATKGKLVTLLDADDEYVDGWFDVFRAVVAEWPEAAQVCYTPCLDDRGEYTCEQPDYRGWLTAEDIIFERHSGEYNPIFRGEYIRQSAYLDLGTRKSCGLLTYIRMAREAPIWISGRAMRIYHSGGQQSVTHGWAQPSKAAETYLCFAAVLRVHGDFIRRVSERQFRRMGYKVLVYRMLSGQGRAIRECLATFSRASWKPWIATLGMLTVGPSGTGLLLGFAKQIGLLRRYG